MPKYDLIGSSEIAKMLRLSQAYVNRLAIEGDLPEAEAEVSTGQGVRRLWERATITKWAQETGRQIYE